MTTWGPQAIAGFARAAGVAEDDLVTATALALAASGGRDHYRWSDPLVLGSDRFGLWALPAFTDRQRAAALLYDPAEAARWLVALHGGDGAHYETHEAFSTPEYLGVLDYVTAALSSRSSVGATTTTGTFASRLANLTVRARALTDFTRTG